MNYKDLNNRIIKIWKKHFNNKRVYTPSFFGEIKKKSILFVSLNPSFSDRTFNNFSVGTEYEGMNYHKFFLWKPDRKDLEEYIKECIHFDVKIARNDNNHFFDRMKSLSESIDMDYEHIDLFLYRETSQKSFKNKILITCRLNEFGRDQIEIAFDAIVYSNPVVIIVANAFGSDLIKNEWEGKLNFDNEIGTYRVKINNKKIPIFFTSMLTGRRSLDKGSFKRLEWHVKNVLNK